MEKVARTADKIHSWREIRGHGTRHSRRGWHGKEAELFVKEVGMPPMEAIVANTSRNAWLMGLEGEVGVIAPGKLSCHFASTGREPTRPMTRVVRQLTPSTMAIATGSTYRHAPPLQFHAAAPHRQSRCQRLSPPPVALKSP